MTTSVKMIREHLCTAQRFDGGAALSAVHQALIDLCDVLRPLGPDGKHGDRHTALCGCDGIKPVGSCTSRCDGRACILPAVHAARHADGTGVTWDDTIAYVDVLPTHRAPCTNGDACGEAAHCPPAAPSSGLGDALRALAPSDCLCPWEALIDRGDEPCPAILALADRADALTAERDDWRGMWQVAAERADALESERNEARESYHEAVLRVGEEHKRAERAERRAEHEIERQVRAAEAFAKSLAGMAAQRDDARAKATAASSRGARFELAVERVRALVDEMTQRRDPVQQSLAGEFRVALDGPQDARGCPATGANPTGVVPGGAADAGEGQECDPGWRRQHANEAEKALTHPLVIDVMAELRDNLGASETGLPAYGIAKVASYAAQVARAQALGVDLDELRGGRR